MLKKLLLSGLAVGLMFSGCAMTKKSKNGVVVEQVKPEVNEDKIKQVINDERKAYLYDSEEKVFTAVGEGIAPVDSVSGAQALVLARKAALADAYKRLGEKLYGVRVTSTETVKDAMLQNSRIVSKVNGLIKDAVIVNEIYKDSIYKLKLELKVSKKLWHKVFSY
jgi:hypothetical protein